jgi:hypothetical protein
MNVQKITLLDHPDGVFLPFPEDFIALHNLKAGDLLDVAKTEYGITLTPRRANRDKEAIE